MYESINSEQNKPPVHLENPNSFSRKRKMLLEDIILCTLSNKGMTTEMELHQYFSQKGVAVCVFLSRDIYNSEKN
ncbi:hypothetical protein [Acetobacterium tundrae]|nr:hypothetical protein [Acetobacterium tundrae]